MELFEILVLIGMGIIIFILLIINTKNSNKDEILQALQLISTNLNNSENKSIIGLSSVTNNNQLKSLWNRLWEIGEEVSKCKKELGIIKENSKQLYYIEEYTKMSKIYLEAIMKNTNKL